jgi:hypothetical protein
VRAGAASHEAGDVPFNELSFPLWCAQRRTAANDDEPLLVRVMEVVRPELLAGSNFLHVSGEEFGADPLGDRGLLNPESLVLHLRVARNAEHVGDVHIRNATPRRSPMPGTARIDSSLAG